MPSEFVLCDSSESGDSQKNMDIIQEEKEESNGLYCYQANEDNISMNPTIISIVYLLFFNKLIIYFIM